MCTCFNINVSSYFYGADFLKSYKSTVIYMFLSVAIKRFFLLILFPFNHHYAYMI